MEPCYINELKPRDTGDKWADAPLEGHSSAVERLDHTQDVGGSIPSGPTPILPQLTASTVARFWRKVKITKPAECWEWIASRFTAKKEQYGCFHIGKRTLTASRVAYAIGYGEEPGRSSVLHKCDNPPCCNPAHLYLGTQADNGRDMRERGRARGAPRYGSANASAKLTEAQVTVIRQRIDAGHRNTDIARDFGVHHSTISVIRRGRSWSPTPVQAERT